MALKLTVTPSTTYIEDSINIKITGGSIPSNYILQIGAWNNKTDEGSGVFLNPDKKNLTSNFNITFPYNQVISGVSYGLQYLYESSTWRNTSQVYVLFELLKPLGSDSYETISEVWKTMYIKPEPPTFNATPSYEDTNNTAIAFTHNDQMIVRGLSQIYITNLNATAYKGATLTTIKCNGIVYSYDQVVRDGILLDFKNIRLNPWLFLDVIDSRGLSSRVHIADVSKFKYSYQIPKIKEFSVERDGISEVAILKAKGYYSVGYSENAIQLNAKYRYKENVSQSIIHDGTTSLTITKTSTKEYEDFLAILQEYNNPTYIDVYNTTYSEIIGQGYTDMTWVGVKDLFNIAISYNNKYTEEYLKQDYQNIGSNTYYICYSAGYNGSWSTFWKETLEAIYQKMYGVNVYNINDVDYSGTTQYDANGGNYEFEIEMISPTIKGDTQNGFSMNKTFNIMLDLADNIKSNFNSDFSFKESLLSTAIPAIDIYQSDIALHGLFDDSVEANIQMFGDVALNGNILNDFITEYGGSSSSNYYAKFKNGTMIQWGVANFTDKMITSAGGGLYRSDSPISKDLEETFYNTDYYPILTGLAGAVNMAYVHARATSSFTFFPLSTWSVNNNNNKSTFFIIFGRWKA